MIRMIASDLDRTLIEASGKMSARTIAAIQKSQEIGVRWVLATGRGFETVAPVLEEGKVSMDLILLNGAEYRSYNGKTRYYETMEPALCKKLVIYLQQHGIDFELNTSEGSYAAAPRFLDDSSDLISFNDFSWDTSQILKIFAFTRHEDRIRMAKKELAAISGVRIGSSAEWNLEFNSPFVDKARMLKKVAAKMNIANDEIMVFGDGENDKSLFEQFPHSRAVGNSVPIIKKLAEKIIGNCEKDGVAEEVFLMLE